MSSSTKLLLSLNPSKIYDCPIVFPPADISLLLDTSSVNGPDPHHKRGAASIILPPEQWMDPAITVTHPYLVDLLQPLRRVGLIRTATKIAATRSLLPKHAARPSDADGVA
jgi:hypothetical protein